MKALEKIADFSDSIGSVFAQVVEGVRIKPIQYNGKVKKNKLETIFTRYAKHCLDAGGIEGMPDLSKIKPDEAVRMVSIARNIHYTHPSAIG